MVLVVGTCVCVGDVVCLAFLGKGLDEVVLDGICAYIYALDDITLPGICGLSKVPSACLKMMQF